MYEVISCSVSRQSPRRRNLPGDRLGVAYINSHVRVEYHGLEMCDVDLTFYNTAGRRLNIDLSIIIIVSYLFAISLGQSEILCRPRSWLKTTISFLNIF